MLDSANQKGELEAEVMHSFQMWLMSGTARTIQFLMQVIF